MAHIDALRKQYQLFSYPIMERCQHIENVYDKYSILMMQQVWFAFWEELSL
jgi:hypothetical protein